jgi:MFS family permease
VASGQPAVVKAWEPLRRPVFRTLWIASVAANLGTWMQSVAAAWLMTSLSPSPTLVALVQTATSLPFLIATLPAGALADIVDRHKLLIVVQVWMSLALAVLTWVGAMTPALLLALTFALGLGWAVNLPIWQSIQPDLVPRRELAQAVTLGGINVNISRAVGPAIGGLVIAVAGPAAAFLINAATFLVGLFVFWRLRGVPLDAELPERLPGAVRTGLRYVRNEPALRAVLVRASLFMVGGSAIMALLPLVARQQLGLWSGGYGILLGCFGAGAVGGATLLPRFRQRASPNLLVSASSVVMAATTVAVAYVANPVEAGVALLVGGMAWLITMANLEIEDRLREFNLDGAPPKVEHLIRVRPDREQPA